MRIIKKGKKPEEKKYRGTCGKCKTVVEFKRSEAKFIPDFRDGDFLTVTCPVCSYNINVNV